MILDELDYKILEAVERHGKEISMAELSKFFPGQEILYSVQKLSKRTDVTSPASKISMTYSNSAYLDERLIPVPIILGFEATEPFYSITHKGKSALQNYRVERRRILRAQKESKKIARRQDFFYAVLGAVLGVGLSKFIDMLCSLFK